MGQIKYICKSNYRYDGDEKLISEHVITRMDTTKKGHKEKTHLIVHKNTTDSIIEHFYFYDKTGDYVRDKVYTYSFDNKTHRLISKTTEHVDSINPIIYPKKLMTLYYYDKMGRTKKIVQGDLDSKRFHKKFKDNYSLKNSVKQLMWSYQFVYKYEK